MGGFSKKNVPPPNFDCLVLLKFAFRGQTNISARRSLPLIYVCWFINPSNYRHSRYQQPHSYRVIICYNRYYSTTNLAIMHLHIAPSVWWQRVHVCVGQALWIPSKAIKTPWWSNLIKIQSKSHQNQVFFSWADTSLTTWGLLGPSVTSRWGANHHQRRNRGQNLGLGRAAHPARVQRW